MKEIQKEKFEKTIVFNGSEYALTFYDDFEGLELDDTKWSYGPESVRHDGKQTYEITSEQVDICRVPTHLKLTVEAGNWAGKCDDSKLPDGILVDYVKVYKKINN